MNTSNEPLFFPAGIPGFEDQTRYRLSHSDTQAGRVYWLESIERPDITFTLVDPEMYGLNYTLALTDAEETLLQVERPDDVVVLLMLWKQEDAPQPVGGALNANIAGPILINVEKRLGMQKILDRPKVELNIID